jgi:predicted transcriptional regulator
VKKPETFTLRIDPDLRKKLQEIANKQERPVGWIVRKAIENYIKENK